MDQILKEEFLKTAQEVEEEALRQPLNVPEEQLEADAKVMLDNLLTAIHGDSRLKAIAQDTIETKSSQDQEPQREGFSEEEVEELIQLGQALKESGRTLDDVLRTKSRRFRWSRRARIFMGIAASLLIVFMVSLNSTAMRKFWIESFGWLLGDDSATTINSEDELHFSENREFSEIEALEIIKNELGAAPIFFIQKPEGMVFDNVYVDADARWAKMFYTYEGLIVTVFIDKSYENMSMGITYDGTKIKEEEIPLFETKAVIGKIQRDENDTAFYAEIKYGDVFYCITGDIEEDVFIELIHNITFS